MLTQRTLRSISATAGAILIVLASGCGAEPNKITTAPQPMPQAVFILHDISRSTDQIALVQKQDVDSLYRHVAIAGGGDIYTGYIKANSLAQETGKFRVDALQLEALVGNYYVDKGIDAENKKQLDAFYQRAEEQTRLLHTVLVKEKTEPNTDLGNALTLAMQTLSSPANAKRSKVLLVLSDCVQDSRNRSYFDPKQVPVGTRILVVRPNPAVDLKALFGREPEVYSTVSEAFMSVNNQ